MKLNILGRSTSEKDTKLMTLKEAATSAGKEFDNVEEDLLSYIISDSSKELPGIHGSLLYLQFPKEDQKFSCDPGDPGREPEVVSMLLRLQKSAAFPLVVIEVSAEQEAFLMEHKSSFLEPSLIKVTKLPGGDAIYAIPNSDQKAGNVVTTTDVKLFHSPGVPTVQSLNQFQFILARGGHMLHRLKKFIGGRQVMRSVLLLYCNCQEIHRKPSEKYLHLYTFCNEPLGWI